MHLEGKAEIWFQSTKLAKGKVEWEEFSVEVTRRFNEIGFKDEVEEFNKLQQEGSVRSYQEKLEELRSLMLIRNPRLTESYFVSSFISGVKEEIKPMLRLLKPATLLEAFEIAVVQEQSLEVMSKKNKLGTKPWVEVSKGKLGSHHSNKTQENSNDKGRAKESGDTKKISPQEIQYRRNNHLCFKCGDKYTAGHQCKYGTLNFLVTDEEEQFEDALGEQDELTGNPGIPMEVSLHALSDSLKRKTITLQGLLRGKKVSLLVDTGSSHTFIHPGLIESLGLVAERTDPLVATIADGGKVISHAICRGVQWQVQKYHFQFDMRIMGIGGWDIILGVDWMYQYSPISFDFKQLKVSLATDKETIMLEGGVDGPVIKLMSGKSVRKCRTEEATTRAVCKRGVLNG